VTLSLTGERQVRLEAARLRAHDGGATRGEADRVDGAPNRCCGSPPVPFGSAYTRGPAGATPLTGDVHVQLLGGFGLRCEGQRVELPLGAQRLVALLALQEAPLLRLYVAGVLWPDTTEKRAYANLRSALWRLRQSGFEIVDAKGANVRLAPGVAVDARESAALAKELLVGNSATLPPDGIRALDSDLLPDWYDDWVVGERERLRQLRLHALEKLSERLVENGSFGLAADAGLAALRDDPLRESASRALIRTFIAEGNPAEALRYYRSYCGLLERELGLKPSDQMKELLAFFPTLSL
jgi:DNA-binding SARP family transcriptional activator